MESRTFATGDSHRARESRIKGRRTGGSESAGRRLLRARKPLGVGRADDEADGIRERGVDVRRHSALGRDRWRDRRVTVSDAVRPETFEIPCRDGLTIRGEAYLPDAA